MKSLESLILYSIQENPKGVSAFLRKWGKTPNDLDEAVADLSDVFEDDNAVKEFFSEVHPDTPVFEVLLAEKKEALSTSKPSEEFYYKIHLKDMVLFGLFMLFMWLFFKK